MGPTLKDFLAGTRHIDINFLSGCPWDDPEFVPGTNLGSSLGQTQVFSLLYKVEARVFPGTNWANRGRRVARKVYVLTVYVLLVPGMSHLLE